MVNEAFTEVIFVGLPGPTHNYGGLSADNLASSLHQGQASRPREAALQVVSLMRLMTSLGLTVGILPPQLRPNLDLLRTKFTGVPDVIIPQAAHSDPALLEAASSSSSMWVANAATVTPAPDASQRRQAAHHHRQPAYEFAPPHRGQGYAENLEKHFCERARYHPASASFRRATGSER